MKGRAECPRCHHVFIVNFPGPKKFEADVVCLKCDHRWHYSGGLTSRVHCPQCRSTKNSLNRKYFGKWSPKVLKSSD